MNRSIFEHTKSIEFWPSYGPKTMNGFLMCFKNFVIFEIFQSKNFLFSKYFFYDIKNEEQETIAGAILSRSEITSNVV